MSRPRGPAQLSLTRVAVKLRCPKAWVTALRKARCLPFRQYRGWKLDEWTLEDIMAASEGAAPPDADLFRVYDRQEAAERLGLTIEQLSYQRGIGRIGSFAVRPALFREADILNYLADQARRARLKAENDEWRRNYPAMQAAAREAARLARQERRTAAREPGREHGCARKALEPALRTVPSGVWYIFWSDNRRSKRLSTGTRDEAQAQAVLRGWIETGAVSRAPLRRVPTYRLRQAPTGLWRIHWSEERRSKCRSTGTKDRGEAQRFFADWLRDRSSNQPKMSSGAASATD